MKEYLYFHWADYTIFGAFLLLFTLIGVVVSWLDRKKTSAKEFLTGGGQSHWVMVALSMQASFLSAIFILSGPGEVYNYGTGYSFICIASVLSMPFVIRFYIPIFYRLNLISAYEYLEKRFNRLIKLLASSLFCIQIVLYLAIVLYAPALALSQATGFSILLAILFCGGVCTTYTCLGGMKATIWNDTIQMCIIYVGLIVIIVRGVTYMGGISEVFRINMEGGRIVVNQFSFDLTLRTTFWTQVVGGFVVTLAPYATNQAIIQKVIGCRSMPLATKSLYFAMASSVLVCLIITAFGMVIYAFYHDCDPISEGRITKIDQIVPILVIELMRGQPGLPGLFMATTFSAALSSMSGCLNSLSAVILTDFVIPLYNNNNKSRVMNERVRVHLSRLFVLLFGVMVTFLSYQAHFLGESVMQLSLTVMSCTGGPMLGLVTLGILFSFVNQKGAATGFIVGLLFSNWIAFGSIYNEVKHPVLPMRVDGCLSNATLQHSTTYPYLLETTTNELTKQEPMYLYRIAFFYYGPIGFLVTISVGLLVSLLTGRAKDVDPNLLYSRSYEKIKKIPDISIDDVEDEEKIILEKSLEWKIDKDTIVAEEVEESTNLNSNSFDLNLNSSKKLDFDMNGNK